MIVKLVCFRKFFKVCIWKLSIDNMFIKFLVNIIMMFFELLILVEWYGVVKVVGFKYVESVFFYFEFLEFFWDVKEKVGVE